MQWIFNFFFNLIHILFFHNLKEKGYENVKIISSYTFFYSFCLWIKISHFFILLLHNIGNYSFIMSNSSFTYLDVFVVGVVDNCMLLITLSCNTWTLLLVSPLFLTNTTFSIHCSNPSMAFTMCNCGSLSSCILLLM